MKYVLDTNIFNCLLDGRLSLSALPGDGEFIVTNVQLRELEATSDLVRRTQLLRVFNQVAAVRVLTESFAYDIPGSGMAMFDISKRKEEGKYVPKVRSPHGVAGDDDGQNAGKQFGDVQVFQNAKLI
jgi:hypothetical protein